MSVRTEIERLNAIKTRIRTNLIAQGITVPSDTMLEEMATMILSVSGEDGYTPIRGVDYWTAADQESIVQQVITALGTPVFGTVDGENNIILTGNLADGTYILKYEDAEGNLAEIGTVTVGGIIDESGDIAITWGVGVKLDKNSGAEGSGAQYAASQSIPYDSSYTYTIATTNDFHVQAAICWYDASGGYLGWNDALTGGSSPGANQSAVLAPKGSAASFRIRAYSIHSTDPERVNSLNRVSLRKDLNQ